MPSCRFLFRIFCVLTAILLSLWPIYKYNLDEDLVQIDFKQFHSTEDRVYPALTLCFDKTTFFQYKESSGNALHSDDQFYIGTNLTTNHHTQRRAAARRTNAKKKGHARRRAGAHMWTLVKIMKYPFMK